MRRSLLVMVLACASAIAGEVRIVGADPLVRPGLLFRCTIQYIGPDVGPCTVTAVLLQGERELSRLSLPLDRSARLGGSGARVALSPPLATIEGGPAPRLAVTISGSGTSGSCEQVVGSVDAVRTQLENHYTWLKKQRERDPLPWLWIEQGAAFAAKPITLGNMHGIESANTALTSWRAGVRPSLEPGSHVRAWRDPVDGSVQPYRLHLPSRSAGAPVAVLLANIPDTPNKEHWPSASESLISAMTTAGIAVIEVYPAGDVTWQGIAQRRAMCMVDDALALGKLGLDGSRPLLIGIGAGATGAVGLAEADPQHWGALLLIDPRGAPGAQPENLTALAVAITGTIPAPMQPWLARLRSAGGIPTQSLSSPLAEATWRWLLAARSTPLPITVPHSAIRMTPGPAGPVMIEALATWGQPAQISWVGDPLRITIQGATRFSLLSPATGVVINGQPFRTPPATGQPPQKVWGQACGPLAEYAARPFVVVVGSGESEAAVRANDALARSFTAAWVAHAQGSPQRIGDRDFRAQDWSSKNLVLIGNPRSNRALQDLIKDGLKLPLEWDARSVKGLGILCLRADNRAIALCWPHPAHDGRLLVILDGAPAWSENGLPLAGLPDLVIGSQAAGGPPLLSRTFSCDWR